MPGFCLGEFSFVSWFKAAAYIATVRVDLCCQRGVVDCSRKKK